MIRVTYRWTVKPGDEDTFVEHWKEGTRRIQANCKGAMGSYLIRSRTNAEHFFGVARWESGGAWREAQAVMVTLNLPGPMPESAEFFTELADMPAATMPDLP